VTDLLYERCGGEWRARRSSYRKLRLSPDWLAATAAACGLDVVECTQAQGLVTFVARRL
jgi:hypothetical protein